MTCVRLHRKKYRVLAFIPDSATSCTYSASHHVSTRPGIDMGSFVPWIAAAGTLRNHDLVEGCVNNGQYPWSLESGNAYAVGMSSVWMYFGLGATPANLKHSGVS